MQESWFWSDIVAMVSNTLRQGLHDDVWRSRSEGEDWKRRLTAAAETSNKEE